MIEVHDVRRRFGNFYAVDGVSFDVREGEIFGLLGANGAGKSTTFRMLCGLLPASAGTLLVAGLDLRHAAAAARARIGYMSQKFSLYGNLSVQENLEFFARAYGLSGARRGERLRWARQEFELEAFADAPSAELPLGYKQRLAMACALMHQPEILFLDEPTSGVDPLARREFWLRIYALARQRRDGAGHHALHGGGGVLRPHRDHGGRTHPRDRGAGADQGARAVGRDAGAEHGGRVHPCGGRLDAGSRMNTTGKRPRPTARGSGIRAHSCGCAGWSARS